jgi:hypothetical protein
VEKHLFAVGGQDKAETAIRQPLDFAGFHEKRFLLNVREGGL